MMSECPENPFLFDSSFELSPEEIASLLRFLYHRLRRMTCCTLVELVETVVASLSTSFMRRLWAVFDPPGTGSGTGTGGSLVALARD